MQTLINLMDSLLKRTVVSVMVLLVLTVTIQVFMRYVVSSPVTFTEELSRYLLIWVGLLSAAYAYRVRMHLALDLLVLKLHGSRRAILNLVIHSLILTFSMAVLVIGGTRLALLVTELGQTSASLGISIGVVYLALPISGVAISLYAVDFIRHELHLFKTADLPAATAAHSPTGTSPSTPPAGTSPEQTPTAGTSSGKVSSDLPQTGASPDDTPQR
jgi:TRAP-type C4-dicarboxylate transport system permease small subunit